MTASEDFLQGYACAMEEIEHRLKNIVDAEDVLDYARDEITWADRKIQELRRVDG